jgi:DNA-binding CsgD family transcriptional regulator
VNEQLREHVMWAGRAAGLSKAEARFLATYVTCDGMKAAAQALGVAEQTARNTSTNLRRRLGVKHLGAAVAVVLYRENVPSSRVRAPAMGLQGS